VLLEKLFHGSCDVQCGRGEHCMISYVAGYVSKASDSLTFKVKEAEHANSSTWRTTYRLLCKRAPLMPEMAMDFAGLPLLDSSFRGKVLHAPVPGSQARNTHRDVCNASVFLLLGPPTATMVMLLRRAAARVSQISQPLRKTPGFHQKRLGSYPVPPEASIWWLNRFQVPGGHILQSMSPFQQKIMWQYFHNFPSRWYWRLSKWVWPVFAPGLMCYIFVYKSCEADVEADIRAKAWY